MNTDLVMRAQMLPVWKTIKNALKYYKTRFKLVSGIVALPLVIYLFSVILKSFVFTYSLSWFVDLVGFVVASFTVMAVYQAIIEGSEQEILACYRKGARKILSFIWLAALTGAITLGGLFLGIIPGIIVGVWLVFSLTILFAEDKRGLNALVRSRNYVRDYWWPVLGRFIVFIVVLGFINFFLMLISSSVVALTGAIPTGFDFSPATDWVKFINLVATFVFFLPLQISFTYGLYLQLKKIKGAEGETLPSSPRTKNWFVGLGVVGVLVPLMLIFASAAFIAGFFGGDFLNKEMLNSLRSPANRALFNVGTTTSILDEPQGL